MENYSDVAALKGYDGSYDVVGVMIYWLKYFFDVLMDNMKRVADRIFGNGAIWDKLVTNGD